VISGSDCGHIFIWNSNTGKLQQLLFGDRIGAINCLEPHPFFPYLVTSGLENTAKVWRPEASTPQYPDQLKGAMGVSSKKIIKLNENDRDFHKSATVLARPISGSSSEINQSNGIFLIYSLFRLQRSFRRPWLGRGRTFSSSSNESEANSENNNIDYYSDDVTDDYVFLDELLHEQIDNDISDLGDLNDHSDFGYHNSSSSIYNSSNSDNDSSNDDSSDSDNSSSSGNSSNSDNHNDSDHHNDSDNHNDNDNSDSNDT